MASLGSLQEYMWRNTVKLRKHTNPLLYESTRVFHIADVPKMVYKALNRGVIRIRIRLTDVKDKYTMSVIFPSEEEDWYK